MLTIIGLFVILLLVLSLPFLVKPVEENLEIFLFVMGVLAVTVTAQWSWSLVEEGLVEPIKIALAVLVAGILFTFARSHVKRAVDAVTGLVGVRVFSFLVIVLLGLLSSAITAIIAALVLVEIIASLSLDRKAEVRLVVIACFAIGMGAALTPIGEPLTTIAIGKLKGEPYHAGFWFLFDKLWLYVVPAVLAFGVLGAIMVSKSEKKGEGLTEDRAENWKDVIIRTIKTYAFVMALVFLGTGFKPIIDQYVSHIPAAGTYWINTVSAILDNATLTAAEVGPTMSPQQIVSAILGLIIAGGMLIPGNIPNIISAGKLKIRSGEWARLGVPIGFVVMAIYFVILLVTGM
jgi:predicted cation transporter